jgi:hypothetical protein
VLREQVLRRHSPQRLARASSALVPPPVLAAPPLATTVESGAMVSPAAAPPLAEPFAAVAAPSCSATTPTPLATTCEAASAVVAAAENASAATAAAAPAVRSPLSPRVSRQPSMESIAEGAAEASFALDEAPNALPSRAPLSPLEAKMEELRAIHTQLSSSALRIMAKGSIERIAAASAEVGTDAGTSPTPLEAKMEELRATHTQLSSIALLRMAQALVDPPSPAQPPPQKHASSNERGANKRWWRVRSSLRGTE